MSFCRHFAASLLASPAFTALPVLEQKHTPRPSILTWELVTLAPTVSSNADQGKTYLTLFRITHCLQSRSNVALETSP